jgi:hypothetical protein
VILNTTRSKVQFSLPLFKSKRGRECMFTLEL